MEILAVIMIVTGMVLLAAGKNVANHLPPDYQSEDDGFRQMLQTMGGLIKGAGVVLLVIGMVSLAMCVLHVF
ncbi:MAG: hypothetical protein K2L07_06005 [Lachnospiraceae bacterium]|nr:hypothetical protein [Lachnospiraceae bacterium]